MASLFQLYLLLFTLGSEGAVTANERSLYDFLLTDSDYRTEVRPRYDASHVVTVEVDVELNQIVTLNERNQILHSTCFIVATWYDEHLTWNVSEFGDVKSIILPPSDVWLPDFGFINSADSFYHASYTKDFRVHLNHAGRVMWSFGGNLETSCLLDMTFFPFDRQQCDFILENWAYTGHQVELINRTGHVLLTGYHKNGEWLLCHSSVHKSYIYHNTFPGQPFPKLSFRIYLKRKPAFYVLNIITPCSFIIVMSLVLFWLPAESGEKASLGITVLLSFSVFQLVVADTIPRTSDSQPVLSVYLAFVMGMSAISTINAVVVLYFHHHLPNYPVPRVLRTVAFALFAPILGMKDQTDHMETANTLFHLKQKAFGVITSHHQFPAKTLRQATSVSCDSLIPNDAAAATAMPPSGGNHLQHGIGISCQHKKAEGEILRSAQAVKLQKHNELISRRREEEEMGSGNPEVGCSKPEAEAVATHDSGRGPRNQQERSLHEVAGCVRFLSRRAQTHEEQELVVRQWQMLGRVVDRLMFCVCSALIIIMCLYLFLRRGEEVVQCLH